MCRKTKTKHTIKHLSIIGVGLVPRPLKAVKWSAMDTDDYDASLVIGSSDPSAVHID